MAKRMFVGTYDYSNLHLRFPEARHVNGKFESSLRQAAMDINIPGTVDGKKLYFSVVDTDADLTQRDEELFLHLTGNYCKIVVAAEADKVTLALNSVNTKYGNQMDGATHKLYKAELRTALSSALFETDKQGKAERANWNNLKVGDIISTGLSDYHGGSTNSIVTKITDKGYSYVTWMPKDFAYRSFLSEAISKGENEFMGSFSVPIKGNESYFSMRKEKFERWVTKERRSVKALKEGDSKYNCYRDSWDHGR